MTTDIVSEIMRQIDRLKVARCRWCKHLVYVGREPRALYDRKLASCPGGLGPESLDEIHLCRWFQSVKKEGA